jgi:hypothetical protein
MWECGEQDVSCRVGAEDALEETKRSRDVEKRVDIQAEVACTCEIAHNEIHFLNFY